VPLVVHYQVPQLIASNFKTIQSFKKFKIMKTQNFQLKNMEVLELSDNELLGFDGGHKTGSAHNHTASGKGDRLTQSWGSWARGIASSIGGWASRNVNSWSCTGSVGRGGLSVSCTVNGTFNK
jgi:hypothetical protein